MMLPLKMFKRFLAYRAKNPAWGSLHLVLDDLNLDDESIEFCIKYAREHKDKEGEILAKELLPLNESQRETIARSV